MSLVESIQSLIFGRKKSPSEEMPVQPPADHAKQQVSILPGVQPPGVQEPQVVEEEREEDEHEISVDELKQIIRKQEIQIKNLDENLSQIGEMEKEIELANKTVDKQEKQVTSQIDEYSKFLKQNLTPSKKQELKLALKELDRSLRSIKDAERKNAESQKKLDQNRKEIERVKKIQEQALEENRDALTQALKSEGKARIKAGKVEDIEKRAMEKGIEVPPVKVEPETKPEEVGSLSTPSEQLEGEDDYWKVGRMK